MFCGFLWQYREMIVAVFCTAFFGAVVSWLVWDHMQEGPRWEKYKIEHNCFRRYKSGEAGPDSQRSGNEGWQCDGPRMIWKNPKHLGVGGQI